LPIESLRVGQPSSLVVLDGNLQGLLDGVHRLVCSAHQRCHMDR
jgi:hypothetical protein